eukprot:6174226-Pleurochrysis_carterae.AAC.1
MTVKCSADASGCGLKSSKEHGKEIVSEILIPNRAVILPPRRRTRRKPQSANACRRRTRPTHEGVRGMATIQDEGMRRPRGHVVNLSRPGRLKQWCSSQ